MKDIAIIVVIQNVTVSVLLGVSSGISISVLRERFGNAFKREVKQIIIILCAFTTTFWFRVAFVIW